LPAFFIDDAEHAGERLSDRLLRPSRQGLGDRIQESYPPSAIRGDDRIADTRERDKQPISLFV
jgi:hypothetical protein